MRQRLLNTLEGVPWDQVTRWATLVMVLAVGIALVIAALRARGGRHGRRRRIEYALLPSPEFETTSEAVIRFASQLGRARRATGIMHHPDANSVRLRLRSVGEGQCLMSVAIPEAAASGVRRAMYPDVESRLIDEIITSLEGPSIASGNGRSQDSVEAAPAHLVPAHPAGHLVDVSDDPYPHVDQPPRVDPGPHGDAPPREDAPPPVHARRDEEPPPRRDVTLWVSSSGARRSTSPTGWESN